MGEGLLFDRVVVTNEELISLSMSVNEFLRIPLHERVLYVLARQLQFFRGDEPVDARAALKSLREWEQERVH